MPGARNRENGGRKPNTVGRYDPHSDKRLPVRPAYDRRTCAPSPSPSTALPSAVYGISYCPELDSHVIRWSVA